MREFKFTCAPKLLFGEGSLQQLPSVVSECKGKRPFVVVDFNLVATGITSRVSTLLENAGFIPFLFDGVDGEPSTALGDECGRLAREHRADVVIGIGGGSALDTAKIVSVLVTNEGTVAQYQGLHKIPHPGIPKIMIPTTAGTGSEVTWTAVFIRKEEKAKAGANSPYLYPDIALLDPELTVSLPPGPTASTGMDAFCHAIESFLSNKSNFFTEAISEKSLALIWKNLPIAYKNPGDIGARSAMLYGSFLAGLSLANAGVTAVHSLSYPLGGMFGTPHGIGNATLLPYVLEDVIPQAGEKLESLAFFLTGEHLTAHAFVERIKQLEQDMNLPTSLRQLKVSKDVFEEIAEGAMKIAVPLQNHPRLLSREEIIAIYHAAY
ncbi:MAG: iron-containing alcohol dehydrogenase [Candidatus Ratteibacteria bacterium]